VDCQSNKLDSVELIKHFIFDLDGVIFDSLANMELSWNMASNEYSIPISFQNYANHLGKPFKSILAALGVHENHNAIENCFKSHSISNMNLVKPYIDIEDFLGFLIEKGFTISVFTSKDEHRAKILLGNFPIKFADIQSNKTGIPGKPNPEQILLTMQKLSLKPSEVIFIGDMNVDLLTARNAGIQFIHAGWGYGKINNENVCSVKTILDLKKTISEIWPK